MGHRRINARFTPESKVAVEGLDATDTAQFKLRVDYVLPSINIKVLRGEVYREVPVGHAKFPSDHYPVYLDILVPAPEVIDYTK